MNKNITMSLLIASLSVTACSHYSDDLTAMEGNMSQPQQTYAALTSASPDAIEPAAGGGSTAGDINAIMAREYYQLAKYENDKAYDYKAAKAYTKKAMTAAKGKTPAPSSVSAFDVTSEQAKELQAARSALISAMKDQNAPENQMMLAKAQVCFDCWLERAEEATTSAHYNDCKEGFEQAMASLVMPAAGEATATTIAPAGQYEVLFAPNSTAIEPSSFDVIEQVGWFLKSPDGRGYTATLTGQSEATVETDYSRKLISDRIRMVREALIAQGIADSALRPEITAVTSQQATPTAGRSVVIALVPPMTPSVSAPIQPQNVEPAAAPAPAPSSVYPAPGAEVKPATPKIVPNTQFKTN